MIVVTTPTIEGHPIRQYLGVVTGETIAGVNAFKDLGAGIRNFVGGRSAGYEKELQQISQTALAEMAERAEAMGANAVIGVDIEYFALGSDNGMLTAVTTGTAVQI